MLNVTSIILILKTRVRQKPLNSKGWINAARGLTLTTHLPSIRSYVLDCIKNFPYTHKNQEPVLATFFARCRNHWVVKFLYDGLKGQVKLSGCYSSLKNINKAYWELVYLVYFLIRVFQRDYSTKETWFTVDQLVEWYQFEHNVLRGRDFFERQNKFNRLSVGGYHPGWSPSDVKRSFSRLAEKRRRKLFHVEFILEI